MLRQCPLLFIQIQSKSCSHGYYVPCPSFNTQAQEIAHSHTNGVVQHRGRQLLLQQQQLMNEAEQQHASMYKCHKQQQLMS